MLPMEVMLILCTPVYASNGSHAYLVYMLPMEVMLILCICFQWKSCLSCVYASNGSHAYLVYMLPMEVMLILGIGGEHVCLGMTCKVMAVLVKKWWC